MLSIGSGDCLACHVRPLHGLSTVGAFPDGLILTLLSEDASDPVGVVNVGCPEATVGIEVGPGEGLNSEGSGRHGWLFADVLSIGQEAISRGR